MTPGEVRRRIQRVRDLCYEGDPTLDIRYNLMLDVLHAIAEGRCEDPQTCAREIIAEEFKR